MTLKQLIATGLCLLSVSRASAQGVATGEPNPANVRVRIGPLYLNPTISLANLGIDTNVFNETTDQNPKRDFTLTVEPKTDVWVRMGRTWISGRVVEQVVWYQKYAGERSTNNKYELGWNVPLNRLSFRVSGSYLRTRERPGFEIDARSQRYEKGIDGAVEIRALAKTYFGVRASELKVNFDKAAVFLDSNLHFELNRTSTTAGASMRLQLTPLTSLAFEVSRVQDRFDFSPLRDSNSTAFSGSLTFDPFALIKGNARIGYRDFQPVQPGLPDYKGSTAAADLSYTLLGTTRFSVGVMRDVQYSFDINQPYYLQTGISGSIAQQVFGPLDVIGRAGAQQLAYRDRSGTAVGASNRIDQVRTYGGGIGYHLGKDLRIGVNVDHYKRTSPVSNRQYEGLKFGTSVTYGS